MQTIIHSSGPQPFWHQRLILWETIFPCSGVVVRGWFGDDANPLHLLDTILLLLHQLHLRSSGPEVGDP